MYNIFMNLITHVYNMHGPTGQVGYVCAGGGQETQLRVLDGRRPTEQQVVPPQLQAINTPLRVTEWQKALTALTAHPDQNHLHHGEF